MRLFKSDWVDRVLQVLKIPDDVPIENKRVTNAIANAQGQVESQNFESRKNVLKYDDVMDRQRKVIYSERREVLEGADIEEQVRTFIDDVVVGVVTGATQEFAEEWDLEQLWIDLKQIWPVSLDLKHLEDEHGGAANIDRDELIEELQKDAQAAYDAREAEVGEEVMRELERRVLLSVLDRKWREHLYEMDYLREGIYLRAYSQRDPLVEYQREGFEMFATMMDGIKEESVGFLFNLEVSTDDEDDEDEVEIEEPLRRVIPDIPSSGRRRRRLRRPDGRLRPRRAAQRGDRVSGRGVRPQPPDQGQGAPADQAAAEPVLLRPSEDGEAEVKGSTVTTADDPFAKVGRNAQCPCGSGKKYKMCHGRPGGPTGLTARAAGG